MNNFNEASDTSDNSSEWALSSSSDEEDVMEAAATNQSMFTQSTGALLLGAHQMGMLDTASAREHMPSKIVRIPEEKAAANFGRKANHREGDVIDREAGLTDEQYRDTILATRYEAWRHLRPCAGELAFHLGIEDCKNLAKAGQVGILTKEYPMLYEDELQSVEAKLQPLPSPLYFVCLSTCSTEGGQGGVGPFHNARQVVTALVTSYRCVAAFERQEPVGLYLLPFQPHFNCDKEFRVFINKCKVTAISQYNEAEECGWGKSSDTDLLMLIGNVIFLVGELLKKAAELKLALPTCFTLDVFCHADQDFAVELIELNSFGAQLAAGSCLFDWVKDYDLLYGLSDTLELRVIT